MTAEACDDAWRGSGFDRMGSAAADHGDGAVVAPTPPTSMTWMTEELITNTRRVWSAAYGRVISVEEAVEILANVKRLAEVLLHAKREKETR